MKTFSPSLFISACLFAVATVAHAGIESTTSSELTGARLPGAALRLVDDSVPEEVSLALQHLVTAGGDGIVQGGIEALAWTGDDYRQSTVPAMISRLTRDLESDGWTYEVGGRDGELTVFSLVRAEPEQRAVVGFFTSSEDALVLAWTELLAARRSADPVEDRVSPPNHDAPVRQGAPAPAARPVPRDPAGKVITVDASATHVNVMGREMPALPEFPALAPKPGRVRGYVKDVNGKPLEGATLGVRVTAVGGFYSGAQGETDANGYYEFPVPAGMAHFYNAGYAIDWGDGLAAMSLHPADGKLGTFATPDGAVENFVLLPYGVTIRENVSESPHLPSTYYGGALYLNHWTRGANDAWAPANNLVEGSMIELTLTPAGEMLGGAPGQSFVIRRPAVGSGFRINNLPVGAYRIRATLADGTPLKLTLNKPRHSVFGLSPTETTSDAVITFAPDGAKASMVIPQYGSWSAVELNVELP